MREAPSADGGARGAAGFIPVTTPDEDDREAQRAMQRSKEQHRVRRLRVEAQTESMRHTMTQQGWQRVILRSSDMFDRLLRQFMARLLQRASKEYRSRLVHLCTRLDYNGFYTSHLKLRVADKADAPGDRD